MVSLCSCLVTYIHIGNFNVLKPSLDAGPHAGSSETVLEEILGAAQTQRTLHVQ